MFLQSTSITVQLFDKNTFKEEKLKKILRDKSTVWNFAKLLIDSKMHLKEAGFHGNESAVSISHSLNNRFEVMANNVSVNQVKVV